MDKFLIAPYDHGLELDIKPFMIPDNAFAQLDNAYVFRGRVRKRFGSRLMDESVDPVLQPLRSRLRIAIPTADGTTDGLGVADGFVPNGIAPGVAFDVGAMFSVGDQIYTVYQPGPGDVLMLSSAGDVARFDTTTGHYIFTGSIPNTQIYFYPSLPVMGFAEYQISQSIDNPTYAFDTKYAYQYVAGGWNRLGGMDWSGNDNQFFWSTNWQGDNPNDTLLFTTNYNAADGITWYDQVVGFWRRNTAAQWTFYTSKTGTVNYLKTARIILPFKDHLVAFNTVESINGAEVTYFNRARWCQNGSPVEQDGAPLEVIAWREDIPGRGGWIDCPCKEPIKTAQFLRDRLIVYFSSSTWEFVYTGNQILPFTWQQINTELGAKSTMSQVPFDKVVLGVGNVGIHACNGTQVERIDSSIPDEVFKINNDNNGPERVYGIRDYYSEMVYWAISTPTYQVLDTYKFPNRILVYNYRNSSWAFNDDSITAFGYYYADDAATWASMGSTWEETTDTWGSGALADLPKLIIAGNQEGFTFFIDVNRKRNAPALQITNITNPGGIFTVIDHNLPVNSYVLIENCFGITQMNGHIYSVTVLTKDTFTLEDMPDLGADVYTGGGTVTRISKIDILTKQFNFYLKEGSSTCVNKVDFLVNSEPQGPNHLDPQLFVECYPTYSECPLVDGGSITGSLLGTGMLELSPYPTVPIEAWQEQLWHPVYFQNEGASVQFHITWTEEQMRVIDYVLSDFQLNAMLIHTRPTASRLY
jgi:hypothetical protein